MRYEEPVYRPPSEAGSLLIQATIGCPHNRCTFCNMYKHKRFRVRPLAEIKEDITSAREYYGEQVQTMFFPDGNTIAMKTPDLAEILQFARATFPALQRITVYGAARFIARKTPEELATLRAAGLSRIHSGLETGDPLLLDKIGKGTTPEQAIAAGQKVKAAGIELSEYILVGIGGRRYWQQHALGSAHVLSQINPDFVRLRTLTPIPGTPLYDEMTRGEFELPTPHGALQETRLLLENLEIDGWLLSDHISNFCNINGQLPAAKAEMLSQLDQALQLPENSFHVNDPYRL